MVEKENSIKRKKEKRNNGGSEIQKRGSDVSGSLASGSR
jgi:hypothetical protein